MPITDPIADLLLRVRNALTAHKELVEIPLNSSKKRIAEILKQEGFIKDVQVIKEGVQGKLRIFLKYGPHRQKAITGLKRVSKPGLRVYVTKDEIPKIFGGLALLILSTNKGIISDKRARELKVGGEIMCYVW